MNKTISFSFVMPAYKSHFLSIAIESILKQTYSVFELIIINDASPDNLKETVVQFQDKRIRYETNQTNIGGKDLVANWNHCIQFAQYDYIILATDDDMFEPEFLQEAAKLIEKYPEADIIRSGVKKIDEKGKVLDIEFPLKEYMTNREFTLQYAKGGMISCVSNYIYRKNALYKIGGFISFPRAHYSDDATALALSLNGVACMNTNNFNFRVSSINLSNRNDYIIVKEQLKATEQYMGWYLRLVKELDTNPGDYFERACYGGFKLRYISMISVLTSKIPISKIYIAFQIIFKNKYLFKKEKYKLFSNYLIEHL